MTPNTPQPSNQAPAPGAWPSDTVDGARLILDTLHALLTGPAAVAYLKPSAMGGATLDAKNLLDAAEAIAADAVARSMARISACGKARADLFRQGPTLHRGE